jgi:hypothetical protein
MTNFLYKLTFSAMRIVVIVAPSVLEEQTDNPFRTKDKKH